jgi:Tfp pilus assembly protein PilF
LDELPLPAKDQITLAASLNAYRAGDLLAALNQFPSQAQNISPAAGVYHAALLLAVGDVPRTEKELSTAAAGTSAERLQRLANALRTLIGAVKREPGPSVPAPELATELLAASYSEQSHALGDTSLHSALELARRASDRSPGFGFAWERVAELEFGFGRARPANAALERSLQLTPNNAQALALKGFLLSGENRPRAAITWFNRSLAVDSALGNAWLGRGLCRIRIGDTAGGREDLLVAAAMEPQRAVLRSYLGKAFGDALNEQRATQELARARELDPKDPTVWLYSALLKQQQNRVNDAIGDLEKAGDLNDNRSLFRSRLLLDQDRAVASANLASIYRDAGMIDVSLREAARAVTYDYANASAHLFLSDSYNEFRDPTRFNLRYETVWFNELLLANLLSPIGGGRLSQNVSQQEYSRLFQADGFGLANSTLGRSDNKSITEEASQYGTFGWSSYAFDLDYQHADGVRPNNRLDSIEWYTTLKQQITPEDTLLALVKYEDYHSGDNFQYYDPANARKNFRFDELQQPLVVGAWHHEWAPGIHTLALGGRLSTEQSLSDKAARQLLLLPDGSGSFYLSDTVPLDVSYHGTFEIYLAELNQIFQWNRLTLSVGSRYQFGSFQTQAIFTNPPTALAGLFNNPVADRSIHEDFERVTGYGYLTFEPVDRLWLTAGAAYEHMSYPDNFRNPPLSPGEAHKSQFGPKLGLVWSPVPPLTVRGTYTRSLGGVSADESFRLEQTQVAGFPQAFRSLISESAVGSVSAPEYETYAGALDLKFSSKTYAGLQVQRLNSDVGRTIGFLSLSNSTFLPSSMPERLRYRETLIGGSINQLLGEWFVVGLGYQFDRVTFRDVLPRVPVSALASARQSDHADLHETGAYVLLNHPSGFFARADATWYYQLNSGYTPALAGDDFVQENLFLGYRFLHRHAEILFGILNLSDRNYHLNPITTYMELPRERTYVARLNFVF